MVPVVNNAVLVTLLKDLIFWTFLVIFKFVDKECSYFNRINFREIKFYVFANFCPFAKLKLVTSISRN